MPDIPEWFHWQMNFCKILIRSNEQAEMKYKIFLSLYVSFISSSSRSVVELRTLAIYTSETDQETFSSSFIDDLSERHFWHCLCYLPNANLTVGEARDRSVLAMSISCS